MTVIPSVPLVCIAGGIVFGSAIVLISIYELKNVIIGTVKKIFKNLD